MNLNAPVLIVTNYMDTHADKVIDELEALKVPVVRWHPDEIAQDRAVSVSLGATDVRLPRGCRNFSEEPLRSVWYRKAAKFEASSQGRESERIIVEIENNAVVKGILNRLETPRWYSHPVFMDIANDKLLQLKVARQLGFTIPPFLVSFVGDEILSFVREHKEVVLKPINSRVNSCGEEDKALQTFTRFDVRRFNAHQLRQFEGSVFEHPLFVQRCIRKVFDTRVTVIGDDITAAAIHMEDPASAMIDWRADSLTLRHEIVECPDDIKRGMLAYLRRMRLNYGAFDFAVDAENQWWFLECNANGQFQWIDDVLGTKMSTSMAEHLAGLRPPLVNEQL
jgi:hypothetical protein